MLGNFRENAQLLFPIMHLRLTSHDVARRNPSTFIPLFSYCLEEFSAREGNMGLFRLPKEIPFIETSVLQLISFFPPKITPVCC